CWLHSDRDPRSFSLVLFFSYALPHRLLPSFPTRRSSDLAVAGDPDARRGAIRPGEARGDAVVVNGFAGVERTEIANKFLEIFERDRKSTRLNSSHGSISYAVFCLKKKKKKQTHEVNKVTS